MSILPNPTHAAPQKRFAEPTPERTTPPGETASALRRAPRNEPFELTTIVQSILRRWQASMLLGSVAGVVASGVAWISIAPQYVATSHLLVKMQGDFIIEPARDVPHRGYVNTQCELARLPRVLRKALKDADVQANLDLRDMTVGQLDQRLSATPVPDSEMMTLSVTDPQALAAQQLANAVTRAYLEEVDRLSRESLDLRLSTLKAATTRYDEELRASYERLGKLGVLDSETLSFRQKIELENRLNHRTRLREVQLKLRQAELRREVDGTPDAAAGDQTGSATQIPPVEVAADAPIEDAFASAVAGVVEFPIEGAAVPLALQPRNSLFDAEQTIAALKLEEESIRAFLAEIDDRLDVMTNQDAVELKSLTQDVALASEAASRVRRAMISCELEQHANKRIQLQALAELPNTAQHRDRAAGAILSGLGAVSLMLVGIAVWDRRSRPAA